MATAIKLTEVSILLIVLALGGSIWFGVRGFQRAGDALDLVLDGSKLAWLRVGLWLGLSLVGAGMGAWVVTYALSVCTAC